MLNALSCNSLLSHDTTRGAHLNARKRRSTHERRHIAAIYTSVPLLHVKLAHCVPRATELPHFRHSDAGLDLRM